jgi:hypothetical protein
VLDSLGAYPHWLVVACAAVLAAVVLWLLVRLIKAAMWLLFAGILIAAVASAAWLLFGQ